MHVSIYECFIYETFTHLPTSHIFSLNFDLWFEFSFVQKYRLNQRKLVQVLPKDGNFIINDFRIAEYLHDQNYHINIDKDELD